MKAGPLSPLHYLLNGSTYREVETFDLMAINGLNTDLPNDKHHEQVKTLRRHFVPVYRKRVSDKATQVVRENDEDIWIVGEEEMPASAMLELAKQYEHLPWRFQK